MLCLCMLLVQSSIGQDFCYISWSRRILGGGSTAYMCVARPPIYANICSLHLITLDVQKDELVSWFHGS